MTKLYPAPKIEPARLFIGRINEQMPSLKGEGYDLGEAKWVTEQRYIHRDSDDQELREGLNDTYFHLGSFVRNQDGSLLLVNPAYLRDNLAPSIQLTANYRMPVDPSKLEAKAKFTREEVERHTGRWLKEQEAKSNPIWQAELGDVLPDYAEWLFSKFQYDEAMGIFVPEPTEKPELGIWCLGGSGGGSDLYGDDVLGSDGGLLLGVAPEAQGTENKPQERLESRV